MGALSGIRILDLSRILAGPWASQILADLGAEVIKIERPGRGDDTRGWGPPFLPANGDGHGDAAYFAAANRNKYSVAVDMAAAPGQRLLRALAGKSDVVIENFKVGGLAKYGLDYDSLKKVKPDLVYCSITGFGQDGPYAQRAGYDFLIQAMGGLMSVTGQPDGHAGAAPMKVGVALTDILTGLYAAIGILAALRHRDLTGEGQFIDLALLDVQVATLANQALNYLVGGVVPGRMGNAHPNIVPYQAFPTADGHMVLTVGNDDQFARFAEIAGHEEWARDPRFATNRGRVENRETLIALIETCTATKPTAWWLARLEAVSVPCGPINRLDQVFADPQVIHRGLKVDSPRPEGGATPGVANPIRLSATPPRYDHPPPPLGAHTAERLASLLDLTADDLDRLARDGVIGLPTTDTPS